jgi:hypothetical protein
MDKMMDRMLMDLDPATHRLRRVGRLSRRRMRIEGARLVNGVHTDGRLTVEISGLGAAAAGAPDMFQWTADRPIALVIVRAGLDGDDVSFQVGPLTAGSASSATVGDGTGIRYVAFCYDASPGPVAALVAAPVAAAAAASPAHVAAASPARSRDERVAASSSVQPSVLARLLRSGSAA